jgi:membrane-bound ClpP family serine protease
MHTIGKNMLSAGIPITLIGVGLYIGGIAAIINDKNSSGGGILAILGCVGIGIGPGLWVAGAVLNKIGKNKEAEYEQRLKLSLGINSIKLSLDF